MGSYRRAFGLASATALAIAALGGGDAVASNEDCPPNPEPGKCYEKVLTPPRYQDVYEQVLDRPGHTERRVIPAVWRDEVVQELVCAEREETYTVPATYRTVTEQVLVREAHYEWRRGVLVDQRPTDPGYTRVTPTGEVVCYVLVPAEYRTVTRQLIDRPARVERRIVPAQYRQVRTRVLVTPERVETFDVPPVYRSVVSRRLISQGGYEWRVIRCADGSDGVLPGYPGATPAGYGAPVGGYGGYGGDTRVLTSPELVRAVQLALSAQGYYRGPADGHDNLATERGLVQFQAARQLGPGWTRDTLRALGVPYPAN